MMPTSNLRKSVTPILILSLLPHWAQAAPSTQPADQYVARSAYGMVAAPSISAAQAGAEILRDGGNAVDAAIATSLAIAVSRPYSAGLGGGGFMMVRLAKTGEIFALDYRETAPAAATPDMFIKVRRNDSTATEPSRRGGLAVATPGLIAGHAVFRERFGTKNMDDLIRPAHRLAAEGFAVDAAFQSLMRGVAEGFSQHPARRDSEQHVYTTFLRDGAAPKIGEIIRQEKLAAALELIAKDGPDAFYRGAIAESIVRTVRKSGGILTAKDLANYTPRWREPLRLTYRKNYELILMPPPSSGGVVIGEALNFLETKEMNRLHRENEGAAAHWLTEAMKHAFGDRARWLGDPDAVKNPVGMMLDKAYARTLAERSNMDRTLANEAYGTSMLPNDAGTAAFCTADRWGNIVAATETINTSFGSYVTDEQFGIVLNNEMDDFTADPDAPNAFALMQSDRNAPRPGRRPLSSMSPTIVLRDGEPCLAIGAAGGPKIITSVLNVIVQRLDYELPLPEAMFAPRLHHQWKPDEILPSRPLGETLTKELERRGHVVATRKGSGLVQAIAIENGEYIGVSDPGKGGAARATE